MAVWGMYLRLSADDRKSNGRVEEANSIQGQRRICRDYIERIDQEATIIEFREKDFISASKGLERPEYRRMFDAMTDGQLDYIVARDQDRFTRDRDVEFGELKRLAKQSGVGVHTVDMGDLFESDERAMASGIRSEFGQYYSKILSKNVRRGVETSRMRGQWTGTKMFGYSRGGVVNPEQAEQIRWAYDQILNHGTTAKDVFTHWRANGVLTSHGKQWATVGAVIATLKAPTIAGLVVHKGQIIDDVRGEWEPIVTPEQRERMVAYFKSRQKSERAYGKRVRRKRALTGKVLCGEPGCYPATMTSDQPAGRPYWYFIHQKRHAGCGMRLRGDHLDQVVTAVATELAFTTPAPADASLPDFDDTELRDIERQIEDVRADLIAGTMRVADGRPILDGLNKRLDEQNALRQQHQEAKLAASNWYLGNSDLIAQGDHDALRAVVDSVRVLPNHAGIVVEATNGARVEIDAETYRLMVAEPSNATSHLIHRGAMKMPAMKLVDGKLVPDLEVA